jgi:hypothetical protein
MASAPVEAALVARLCAHAGVNGLAGERIYPLVASRGSALPLVVYREVSRSPTMTHAGRGTLVCAGFEFTCLGDHYAAVKELAGQVESALSGWQGVWPPEPAGDGTPALGAVAIRVVTPENIRPGLFGQGLDEHDPTNGLYKTRRLFSAWYMEL